MKKKPAKKVRRKAKTKSAYLTKRGLMRAVRPAIKKAAKQTLEKMGHAVIYKDGYIVDVDVNGKVIRKIKKVKKINHPAKIALD